MARDRATGDGRAWAGASALLLVLGLGLVAAGVHAQLGPDVVGGPAPPSVATLSTPPRDGATEPPPTPPAVRALPVELLIPAIHVAVPVGRLGLKRDGTVQVPADPARAGWYQLGTSPGETGSAVILGHVDSTQGPAAFYLLSALHPKDRLAVRLTDGSVSHFEVTAVGVYQGAQFPRHRVYDSHGYAALQLVTCGGGYDTQAGHYLGNVVIYSRLVSVTQPR